MPVRHSWHVGGIPHWNFPRGSGGPHSAVSDIPGQHISQVRKTVPLSFPVPSPINRSFLIFRSTLGTTISWHRHISSRRIHTPLSFDIGDDIFYEGFRLTPSECHNFDLFWLQRAQVMSWCWRTVRLWTLETGSPMSSKWRAKPRGWSPCWREGGGGKQMESTASLSQYYYRSKTLLAFEVVDQTKCM